MYHTRAWLNGENLGEHIDGYLPFSFDITGKLKRPENHLVLRVDNRPRIEWLPAAKQIEWVRSGGILQPVVLESRNPTAITNLAIRAVPRGTGAALTCSVEIEAHQDLRELLLRVRAAGREQAQTLNAHAGNTSRHELALTLDHADPWSPESPNLQELEVTLEHGGRLLDRFNNDSEFVRSKPGGGSYCSMAGRYWSAASIVTTNTASSVRIRPGSSSMRSSG